MHVEKTYPLHIAAAAAQSKPREFRRKVDNGFLAFKGCDRASTGTGDPAGYSQRRILQAAIIKGAGRLVSSSTASDAALKFTDEGNLGRAPGELYPHGRTVLLITPDDATVKNLFSYTSLSDVSNSTWTVIVDLNRLAEQVSTVLTKFESQL
jgi:hypothetical protein